MVLTISFLLFPSLPSFRLSFLTSVFFVLLKGKRWKQFRGQKLTCLQGSDRHLSGQLWDYGLLSDWRMEKNAYPRSSDIQSSGKHFRPNTDSSEKASVSSLILKLKKLSTSDPSTIIEAVIRNLRKATNPAFLGFYHLVCLSSFALIQSFPVLECLLYPKHCLNFWNFKGEWDLSLPWRNSSFSGGKAPEEIITVHLIRSGEEVWKDCYAGIELLNWCCLGIGKKCWLESHV